MSNKNLIIKVVVGIISNSDNELLITKRKKDQFMPGYWELPGGKIESEEDNISALKREFFEEVGVTITECKLIQKLNHHYVDKTVQLWVYNVEHFSGKPFSKEGQEVAWVSIEKFKNLELLPTMWKIINTFNLPNSYWITPDNHQSNLIVNECENHLVTGTKIIQLRSKNPLDSSYINDIYKLCKDYQAKLILNTPNKTYKENCDGWHLTSSEFLSLDKRPFTETKLFGASTHNEEEVRHAEKIFADYISLSPIQETQSHPNILPLGWEIASSIIEQCDLPVFLLGGMNRGLIKKALGIGAQGIAGIRDI